MSLEALKELSALDGEAKGLLQRLDEQLLAMRRRFLNKIVECFAAITESEGFRIQRDPMGASARLAETELAISCTDPSHTLVDSQAKYSVTCSLALNKTYAIFLCRQPLVEFTHPGADTNDQITNKKLEIQYLKSRIETHGGDHWFVRGRLESSDGRGINQSPATQYESFQSLERAVKTALREISKAAVAPRA